MQRVFLAAMMIFLFAGIAGAQDFPKAEIFGGYSLMRLGGENFSGFLDEISGPNAPEGVTTSRWLKKGFDASLTYNLNRYLGIEAAFQYNTGRIMKFRGIVEQYPGDPIGYAYNAHIDANDFSFAVGPKIAYRKARGITPFAHVLVGVNRVKLTPALTVDGENVTDQFREEIGVDKDADTGFGLIAGGGIDLNINKSFAIRPIQFDYLMGNGGSPLSIFKLHNAKLSFGVVVRLGGK